MMRGFVVVLVFISIIFFPWPLSMLLVAVSSFFIPLLPFAAGVFADTLYYAPRASGVPFLCSLGGAALSGLAFFVRSRLWAGSIGG